MTFRTTMMEYFFYPSIDMVRNTKIISKYHFLMKSQWWSQEKINELQNQKLRKLIHYVYENVPYYHELFDKNNIDPPEIKTKDDLEKIPPLTKDMVRKYSDSKILAKNAFKSQLELGRTGGSTGEPLHFYRDKNTKSWGWGAMYRFWNWQGLGIGEKMFQFSGGSLGGFLTSKSKLRIKFEQFLTGAILLPAFEMTPEKIAIYLDLINKRNKVYFLRGYPSTIYLLAKYINKYGVSLRGLKGILTTAERLYDFQREEIEKAFQCHVYDQYGCGEIHGIAAQCEYAELYHVADEHVIIETHDIKENSGTALITNLDNYQFPFIRYKNGDILKKSNEKCQCKRNLSLLEKIIGRTHDYIVSIQGFLIPGEFFPHLFQSIRGIDRYFIHQKTMEKLIIRIIPNDKFSNKELSLYLDKIKEYVGQEVVIEVEKVDEIPLSTSGKNIFIKSDVLKKYF